MPYSPSIHYRAPGYSPPVDPPRARAPASTSGQSGPSTAALPSHPKRPAPDPLQLQQLARRRRTGDQSASGASSSAVAAAAETGTQATATGEISSAAEEGDAEKLRTLLASFSGDLEQVRTGESGETLLHLAARSGSSEAVQLLLNSGRIRVDATDANGNTALIPALSARDRPTAELLVRRMHARAPHAINRANQTGMTPLMTAAGGAQHEMVRVLLARGADPSVSAPDHSTALTLALDEWKSRLRIRDRNPEAAEAAMLTAVALTPLDPAEKFKFHYRTTRPQERMLEEDQFAQRVIHSEESKAAVFAVARAAVAFFRHNGVDVASINNWKERRTTLYAMLRTDFKDEADLAAFIETHASGNTRHGHVKLLSLLWYVTRGFPSSWQGIHHRISELDSLYKNIIEPTRDYKVRKVSSPVISDRFGNASVLKDDCFADEEFFPFHRALDYLSIDPTSRNPTVRNYLFKGKPCVSGLSGMMNMTGRLLEFLDLYPRDPELGVPFVEAMAAFIVGSGMHSYPEVYRTINLHLKLMKAREMLVARGT